MNQSEASEGKALTKMGLDRPLLVFFILAYAIAWGVFGLIGLVANRSGLDAVTLLDMGERLEFGGVTPPLPPWLLYGLTRLADFAFSIAGLIMIAIMAGTAGLRQLGRRLFYWRFPARYYLLALLPLGLYGLAAGVAAATATEGFSVAWNGAAVSEILFSIEAGFFVTLFLRGAMGEEIGLRGFALPQLQARLSPFRASLVIGALWGAWHLPVLLGRDLVSIVAFLLLSFGLSFIFTWMYNGSGGSLIPGLLFHALQNWEESFEIIFPDLAGTDWEIVSSLGLLALSVVAGFAVWRQGRTAAVD